MPHFTCRGSCEKCNECALLAYFDPADEYWCGNCIDNAETNAAEAAWERHCEDFHDGGSTQSWNDGQPPKAKKDYIR